MKSKMIRDNHPVTYVLIFDKGDEFLATLLDFAKEHDLMASSFTGIGAFSGLTLGYFDRDRKDYKKIKVDEQVEVLSLMGDISLKGDEPKIHAHVVVGKSDGAAHGGHVLEAHVWPTLELVVTDAPNYLRRKTDDETGLALIDIDARL